MTMHILHLTCVTFPSTPRIDFAKGSLSLEMTVPLIHFVFSLLFAKFASTWVRSTTITTNSTFWLKLVITKGSTRTRSKKKKCLKFLGTSEGGAMPNVTTKIKIKISHLKSKTLNFQM
jgi:hypothetical protein